MHGVDQKSESSDGAGVSWRRCLAASDEELEREGEVEVDVEELELDGGAEADGGLQLHQPLQHRAALVHYGVAEPHVHQPAQQVHARADLQRVRRARRRRRRRRGRRRWRRARHVAAAAWRVRARWWHGRGRAGCGRRVRDRWLDDRRRRRRRRVGDRRGDDRRGGNRHWRSDHRALWRADDRRARHHRRVGGALGRVLPRRRVCGSLAGRLGVLGRRLVGVALLGRLGVGGSRLRRVVRRLGGLGLVAVAGEDGRDNGGE
jgi:hypothetical protein